MPLVIITPTQEVTKRVDCNGKVAKVLEDFTAPTIPKDVKDEDKAKWMDKKFDELIKEGKLQLLDTSNAEYGADYRTYKISDLKEDKKNGIKGMTAPERITKYLQAAFRSGDVMGYGQVYISDIVLQLCALEGWAVGKVISTAPSSYKSSFLSMNGMTALEYISTVLAENAVEADGMGRSGFKAYFKDNRLNFEPANQKKSGIVLTMGYNQDNSPVLSFTVRSRGQLLMTGVDENVSEINAYSNESMSSIIPRSSREMSGIEKDLYDKAVQSGKINKDDIVWFNSSWFNYYGYEKNADNYAQFTKNMANNEVRLSYGDSLVQIARSSSASTSTEVVTAARKSLESLRELCIKAEATIIGDNNITPGQWITINNITARGNHYTSGDYYVQSITDQVTASNGFTQNLVLWRYSRNIYSFDNNIEGTPAARSSTRSRLIEAGERLADGSFDEWYEREFKE